MPTIAHRVVRRLRRSLRTRGLLGSLRHALKSLGDRIRGQPTAAHDAEIDRDFDRRFGVDTGGVIAQADLDVDTPNWVHGSAYVATSPIDFAEVLAPFDLDLSKTSFIDLGCGKGRVLLMASALPFARVVGVEYSESLASIARDNLMRYRGPRTAAASEVVIGDASAYAYPDGDLVVFMYHPFDEVVMQRVIDALRQTLSDTPRRLLVLYFKPVYADLWQAADFVERRHASGLYNAYEGAARPA
jgi:SAM-dependent methyltransferase